MQKILRKRVIRDLCENLLRYLALGFLIIFGMFIIISLVGAADTVITGVEEKGIENGVEDGEFNVFVPMTQEEIEILEDEGVTLEKMFSLEFRQKDESVLRVYKNRNNMNLVDLDEGKMAEANDEVVLEKRYCREHKIQVGNQITIGGKNFKVVGIGSTPDYDAPLRNLSDSRVDSENFGTAFVTEKVYQELQETGNSISSEEYTYAYQLNKAMTGRELKEAVTAKLTQFVKAENNPRIAASADDQVIGKTVGLLAGIIIMVLFTYVISVFVIHSIEKESSIIGTLYAMGVKRKELMVHYLMLPVLVTFAAGMIGTIMGYSRWGINSQMGNCYNYFSVPDLQTVYKPYLIVYGVIMPPVVAAIVNCMVIYKRLSVPVLQMIRNEQKSKKVRNIGLGNMGFIGRFRIRQMMREMRTGFTVCFGMFISLLIMMIGIDCHVLCQHISEENRADTKYEYMYTYKVPEEDVPEGGEACYAKKFKKEILGYNMDVTLLGIDENNPYFEAEAAKSEKQVVLSSAMAQKYGISEGEQVVLNDEEEEKNYTFTVKDVAQFSTGLYVFMDIDSMRELFHKEKDYYNVVLADKKLEIDADRLYAVTTKSEISKRADVFTELLKPMLIMLITVSVLIFAVVMYLMMKVMIDRSATSISLMKIFGYRTGEIRKLYLNGNFYIIAIGAAICLPLTKKIIDTIYPYLISNVACGMNLTFSWQLYAGVYIAVLLMYFVINQLLVHRLKKMIPAEVLKNRE